MYTRRAVKTGKYFDFINENRTSSDALRPIFPKLLLKAWQNRALFLPKEHLNFIELSKYTPKYLQVLEFSVVYCRIGINIELLPMKHDV